MNALAENMTTPAAVAANDGASRPPRPWLAALRSLVPGLGHLYAGRGGFGLLLLGVEATLGVLMAIAMMRMPGAPANVVLPIVVVAAFRVWVVVHGWRTARRAAPRRTGRPRLLLLGAGFALLSFGLAEVVSRTVRAQLGQAFRIPSVSMAPTVLPGDYVVADPIAGDEARRNDVIAYRRPQEDVAFTHRLVGVPGDTLAMADGVLYRNGRAAREPWAVTTAGAPDVADPSMRWQDSLSADTATGSRREPSVHNWGPLVVPSGHGFVLGDNRDNSMDSRYWGFVPLDRVFARLRRVYYSRDPETGAIRWGRIGRDVPRVGPDGP